MSIFSRLFGRKPEIRADSPQDAAIITFFASKETISRSETLEIPTVSACISKLAETISRLPVKLYRKNDGKVTEITDDSRLKLLNGETGDTLSPVDMWRAALEDYYVGRGAWIYVDYDGRRFKGLHYVEDRSITVQYNTDPIFKAFDVMVNGRKYYDFQFIKLFRKTRDGFTNIPIQNEASAALAAAYNGIKLENTMNYNGGRRASAGSPRDRSYVANY